jgi:type IV pilus assembly protein PilA
VKNESGFTIIELLVVCAIIGVLATLALSNFSLFKGNALNATAASDARTLLPAADLASNDESTTFPAVFVLTGEGGTAGLGVLATKFGGRYSPNTLGTVVLPAANHYIINTQQRGMSVCYTVDDGVMSVSGC